LEIETENIMLISERVPGYQSKI